VWTSCLLLGTRIGNLLQAIWCTEPRACTGQEGEILWPLCSPGAYITTGNVIGEWDP
jgi:hypothetical protein